MICGWNCYQLFLGLFHHRQAVSLEERTKTNGVWHVGQEGACVVEELFFVEELGENMSCGHSGHCREKWRQVGHKVWAKFCAERKPSLRKIKTKIQANWLKNNHDTNRKGPKSPNKSQRPPFLDKMAPEAEGWVPSKQEILHLVEEDWWGLKVQILIWMVTLESSMTKYW